MRLSQHLRLVLFISGLLLLFACSSPAPEPTVIKKTEIAETSITSTRNALENQEVAVQATAAQPIEVAQKGKETTEAQVTAIELTGPVAARNAEISGLAWYGDYLIILPQYPARISSQQDGAVLALSKEDIIAYLEGARDGPLAPTPIPFLAPGLSGAIQGFEGYEAIAFLGERVFVTIEASTATGMRGYLVSGSIAPDLSGLTLDTTTQVEIQLQTDIANKSDETLIAIGETIATIHEVNGVQMNASPIAHLFDLTLDPLESIPFPNIEYRITDATALDDDGRFWAINYFFPGDGKLLPETDPLANRFGAGPTHARYEAVERLVELRYGKAGIELTGRPPIQLELLPNGARNWEGLVRLDQRGFLMMTDEHPGTILGFVPLPDGG